MGDFVTFSFLFLMDTHYLKKEQVCLLKEQNSICINLNVRYFSSHFFTDKSDKCISQSFQQAIAPSCYHFLGFSIFAFCCHFLANDSNFALIKL